MNKALNILNRKSNFEKNILEDCMLMALVVFVQDGVPVLVGEGLLHLTCT